MTAKTKTTVSLAWNTSTDNSGSVSYTVQMWKDGGHVTVATEVRVFWTASTDDQDPPEAVRYQLFINGVLDVDFGTPIGVTRAATYGDDGKNTFVLRRWAAPATCPAPATRCSSRWTTANCERDGVGGVADARSSFLSILTRSY